MHIFFLFRNVPIPVQEMNSAKNVPIMAIVLAEFVYATRVGQDDHVVARKIIKTAEIPMYPTKFVAVTEIAKVTDALVIANQDGAANIVILGYCQRNANY